MKQPLPLIEQPRISGAPPKAASSLPQSGSPTQRELPPKQPSRKAAFFLSRSSSPAQREPPPPPPPPFWEILIPIISS